MKTLTLLLSGALLLSAPLMAQREARRGRPYAKQWVELRSTSYYFPDARATVIARGEKLYTPARIVLSPLSFIHVGVSAARLWFKERLITRIGYDCVIMGPIPPPDYLKGQYYQMRTYNFYTLEAGPSWALGRMKRHMLTSTLGLIRRRGWESYNLGSSMHSGGFYESYFAGRRNIDDRGGWGKLEYHFSPIRYLRVGLSAQYQRYYAIRGDLSYNWPQHVVPLRGQLCWGAHHRGGLLKRQASRKKRL